MRALARSGRAKMECQCIGAMKINETRILCWLNRVISTKHLTAHPRSGTNKVHAQTERMHFIMNEKHRAGSFDLIVIHNLHFGMQIHLCFFYFEVIFIKTLINHKTSSLLFTFSFFPFHFHFFLTTNLFSDKLLTRFSLTFSLSLIFFGFPSLKSPSLPYTYCRTRCSETYAPFDSLTFFVFRTH